ncbi:family 1 glycosylhydrolase [Sphingomonas sp. PL-96]|uniref:family 1 glycosylhydrolase n=1 Tax=Sphingomonas sp. PL-96 TaxID=2887201 RepID=UPI001E450D47|nr:family 1 glycosylhydrolase [Sphingomonas sp. PL-96]MCC2978015.1 family 1 glycosylhydrolase [Sphingomonas sp. PL-96]
MRPLELWGGHECTVNRVGDQWFDQTFWSGHQDRLEDLSLFAGLGIRSLRYPALWERISPDNPDHQDFAWTDARLAEIRRLGMNPILTLCHHGSGPHYTSLLDEGFAPGLARHAAAVAARYPWVRDYTPVNEPLTTARFSALYGYWYPHRTDERSMWVALLNEIDATRLAMRAIREINPAARLIQTDDLGHCHATPPLQGEADFQNERRWMGWDLLCGMVVPGHALFERLAGLGLADRLRAIAEDPCPPDIIGVNHYLSSERLLDHRIERHEARSFADRELGEIDGVVHVDVDAIAHIGEDAVGFAALLEQAWQRYRLPVAVTECHLGGTRDDQARWFVEVWELASDLRRRGVDLRAVTVWSLLGAWDWNRMVTRPVGHYESGVFDVRMGSPRPTMMARVLKDLAQGRQPDVPGLGTPGWWRKDQGFARASAVRGSSAPILIVGTGALAEAAAAACRARDLPHVETAELDTSASTRRIPWALLDVRLDVTDARLDALHRWCTAREIGGVVFGRAELPPSGGAGDRLLVAEVKDSFTPADASALPARILDALDAGEPIKVHADSTWHQLYVPDLADAAIDLLLDGMTGTAAFERRCTEVDLARTIALIADGDPSLLNERGRGDAPASAGHVASRSFIPTLESTIERFVRERRQLRC